MCIFNVDIKFYISIARLLKNPPAPVVLSPPRLATTSTAINYIISQVYLEHTTNTLLYVMMFVLLGNQ